jgi:hypothetical protein
MKNAAVLLGVCLVASVHAQDQKAEEELKAQIAREIQQATTAVQPEKPNEITTDRATYKGVAVQMIKTDNPLQLVNPLAPPRYGRGEDNVVRDPITRKVTGISFLTIEF